MIKDLRDGNYNYVCNKQFQYVKYDNKIQRTDTRTPDVATDLGTQMPKSGGKKQRHEPQLTFFFLRNTSRYLIFVGLHQRSMQSG